MFRLAKVYYNRFDRGVKAWRISGGLTIVCLVTFARTDEKVGKRFLISSCDISSNVAASLILKLFIVKLVWPISGLFL